jgi:hypothetical protein
MIRKMNTAEQWHLIAALLTVWIAALISITCVHALDRCESLITDARIEHTRYFGIQYPYWYGVGQLKQESACRTTVTAADAGQGVAQFMPKTAQYISSLMGEALDPYNPKQAIRMQAFYMHRIHTKENWSGVLWIAYQIYNGGKATLYGEFQRAQMLDWDLMKICCQRKKIQMKWGVLDFCEVNYDYSKKVEKYGNQYRRGTDGINYW